MKDTEIKSILYEKGVKPSFHRIKILKYLLTSRNHPTVDTIHRDISSEIPTLSKTTVYNTLKLLNDRHIVKMLTIEEKEVKFDAAMDDHAHLKCIYCSQLYDISIINPLKGRKKIDEHIIIDSHIYFMGICRYCQMK